MARGKRAGVLIAGGGLAGCLAALALARLRPEVPLMIVEERTRFGGEGFHYLFDAEAEGADPALMEPLVTHRWPGFYAAFPGINRKLKAGMTGFDSETVHQAMLATLRPDQYRLGTRVVAVRSDALELDGGETVRAEGAIDARGAANLSMLELLYEARLERMLRLASPHRLDRPLLIDATMDQAVGLGFVQAFPLEAQTLRIAQVLVSERAQPEEAAEARLANYLVLRGWEADAEPPTTIVRPLAIGGDFSAFWRIGGARVAKLGLRGGFVQPTTGRTAPDALRNALLLARQQDFTGEALHDLFEAEARAMWKKRELARGVNAAFADGDPEARRALAERLWGLDAGTLLRLQTERLGLLDRRRIQQAVRG